jgi:hypothetical protein
VLHALPIGIIEYGLVKFIDLIPRYVNALAYNEFSLESRPRP